MTPLSPLSSLSFHLFRNVQSWKTVTLSGLQGGGGAPGTEEEAWSCCRSRENTEEEEEEEQEMWLVRPDARGGDDDIIGRRTSGLHLVGEAVLHRPAEPSRVAAERSAARAALVPEQLHLLLRLREH